MPYHGFSNVETGLLCDWLAEDSITMRTANTRANAQYKQDGDFHNASMAIKGYVLEQIPSKLCGIWHDYISQSLSLVNWAEVATFVIEQYDPPKEVYYD